MDKELLKSCLREHNFVQRMTGSCKQLKEQYEQCMAVEFQKLKQENLKQGRKRTQAWKEANSALGLKTIQ